MPENTPRTPNHDPSGLPPEMTLVHRLPAFAPKVSREPATAVFYLDNDPKHQFRITNTPGSEYYDIQHNDPTVPYAEGHESFWVDKINGDTQKYLRTHNVEGVLQPDCVDSDANAQTVLDLLDRVTGVKPESMYDSALNGAKKLISRLFE
jgi:hypothetical protein